MSQARQQTPVKDGAELREILGPLAERAKTKERRQLHRLDQEWMKASPFFLAATSDRSGRCDVSPRGDPAGSIVVLDDTTIAIAERPGNRRADGLHNILQNPHIGLVFVIPGRGDTLRVNGTAIVVRDGEFFEQMIVKGQKPALAIVVSVEEVFFHCSKAFLRSKLWDPSTWCPEAMPARAKIAHQMERADMSLEELHQYYGPSYGKKLY